MGIWDWIVNAVTGDSAKRSSPGKSASRSSRRGSEATYPSTDTAVALAEPPDPSLAIDPPAEDTTAPDQPTHHWWAPEGVTATDPGEYPRPDLCTEALAVENMLVSHFDGHNLTLPSMPHVPELVLRRLRDPKSGLDQVAKDIAEDQVIAAEVIRMANSPLYRGLHKITALQPAVTRLGATAIRTLMMNQSLRAATFHRKGTDRDLASIAWYRSLASACIMRWLSRFAQLDEEDAFLMGLLHDIGNVIVLRIADENRAATGYEIDVDSFEYLCHESHQEFGELIAEAWKLPSTLRSLVSDHHTYPEPDDDLRVERQLLYLTDMLSQMLGYGPPASYDVLESRAVQDLGLAERDGFLAFLTRLPQELEETLVSFGGVTSDVSGGSPRDPNEPILTTWLAGIRRGRTQARQSLGQRKHHRWSTSTKTVTLWLDEEMTPSPVSVADVSEGGMCVRLDRPLEVGQTVSVGEGNREDTITGTVANVSNGPVEGGLYRIGIQFADSPLEGN